MKCAECKNQNFGICPRKDQGQTYPIPERCTSKSTHKRKTQSWIIGNDLTYNQFHLRRISDALNKRDTQINPTEYETISMDTTEKERLFWIIGSLAELQFEGFEFGDGTVTGGVQQSIFMALQEGCQALQEGKGFWL